MDVISRTVDARGQSCPGPLVTLAKALKDAERGDLLELLATDPGSRSDVPSWSTIRFTVLAVRRNSPPLARRAAPLSSASAYSKS